MNSRTLQASGKLSPLQALLPGDLQLASMRLAVPKGKLLFRQRQRPQHMYFVATGEVVLNRVGGEGEAVVLQRVRRGILAEASLHSPAYHCEALVTAPGEVVALPIQPLKDALARDPLFAMRWIGMLSAEVKRLRAQVERISLNGVRQRIVHLIETEGIDGTLPIESNLKSMATELAVTHEALYRTLAAMEKEGCIRRDPRRLTLVPSRGVSR